jgi:amidase
MNNKNSSDYRDSLQEAPLSALRELLDRRQLSTLELVDFYLDRIEKIDRSGPSLNSVLEINPNAREIAREIDRKGTAGYGPLAGIPILLKGNIDTADSMESTAGSPALTGRRPGADAELVRRLREAGAVILGKTNLSEWANFRSTRSSSGWSALGGQTKNPYMLDRNPCGSSSGSGAAVSAGLCAAAVGTETDGSIICPSSANGIVGIKPTVGLVSQRGIIPISASQDTAGPMTRTVEDGAALLGIIAEGFEGFRRGALAGARIGLLENFLGERDDVDKVFREAADVLASGGAKLVPVSLETKGRYEDAEFEVLLYEFKDGINRLLAASNAPSGVRSLEELISWNRDNAKQVMPWFGQDILEKAVRKGSLEDKAYRRAAAKVRNMTRTKGIDALLRQHRLDALTAPSGGPAWKTDLVNGDHFSVGSSSCAAAAGYPNITVPAGFIHGLPVGISFFGAAFSEPMLIGIARDYEGLSNVRRPPEFIP